MEGLTLAIGFLASALVLFLSPVHGLVAYTAALIWYPWYREIEPDEPGRSLVLVRTERGQAILHKAMEAGYVELEKVRPEVLAMSQRVLLNRKQNFFWRWLAMRIMCILAPRFMGFPLFSNWQDLSVSERTRSIVGAFKRIFQRNWTKPLKVLQGQ